MTTRQITRIVHLVGAASLGALVYSPLIGNDTFLLVNQALVVPALSISGLWMWFGHRLRSKRRS